MKGDEVVKFGKITTDQALFGSGGKGQVNIGKRVGADAHNLYAVSGRRLLSEELRCFKETDKEDWIA